MTSNINLTYPQLNYTINEQDARVAIIIGSILIILIILNLLFYVLHKRIRNPRHSTESDMSKLYASVYSRQISVVSAVPDVQSNTEEETTKRSCKSAGEHELHVISANRTGQTKSPSGNQQTDLFMTA